MNEQDKKPATPEAGGGEAVAEQERLRKENTVLRGLLRALGAPCVYCGLTEMSRCASGFPGCPQADDLICAQMECPAPREQASASLGIDPDPLLQPCPHCNCGIEVMPDRSVRKCEFMKGLDEQASDQPTELEMHRVDYAACKAAGFESPGELLSAYKTQASEVESLRQRIAQLEYDAQNALAVSAERDHLQRLLAETEQASAVRVPVEKLKELVGAWNNLDEHYGEPQRNEFTSHHHDAYWQAKAAWGRMALAIANIAAPPAPNDKPSCENCDGCPETPPCDPLAPPSQVETEAVGLLRKVVHAKDSKDFSDSVYEARNFLARLDAKAKPSE